METPALTAMTSTASHLLSCSWWSPSSTVLRRAGSPRYDRDHHRADASTAVAGRATVVDGIDRGLAILDGSRSTLGARFDTEKHLALHDEVGQLPRHRVPEGREQRGPAGHSRAGDEPRRVIVDRI